MHQFVQIKLGAAVHNNRSNKKILKKYNTLKMMVQQENNMIVIDNQENLDGEWCKSCVTYR